MTDQQIDEFLEMLAKSPTSARDMVRGLFAANEAKAAPASTQDEPFGYFRVDALGWTDCAATDEGAIALYERPAAPAAPAAPDVMSILRAIHRRPSDAGIWLDDITRILRDAPAPAVPNVLKRGYGRLIQAAADLALQQFMPSDIVDDYPSKTISAAKVAKMMTQPRDRLRLLSIEVSEGAKQMLAATPAAPSQEHAVNLSCRSTQARLAAQWGYVPAPSQEPAVPQGWKLAPVEPTPEMKAAGINIEVYSEVSDSIGALTWAEVDAIYRAMLAATPAAPSQEPALHIGACITDGVLHATVMRREANGHVTILAKAEMDAKSLLEHDCVAKLSPAAPSQGPVTDEYAGVIAWVGDKQCKRVITEGAIKHEHTPGVAMRNAAHQCVQEVIITALREKEGK